MCTLSIWDDILQYIDRTNKSLQQKNLAIDCGIKLIARLHSTIQGVWDTDFEQNLAEEMGIEKGFFNTWKKRVKIM